MKIGPIDLDNDILVVAEIGNNHEGSYTLAEELIGLAAEAGAGAVKFQTIVPEFLVSLQNTARIEQLKKYQFSYEQFVSLKKTADRAKVMFLSTPFDIESAKFLGSIVPAFKIASGDNNFHHLLRVVARTGKPIILSAGLANYNETRVSVDYIKALWKENKLDGCGIAVLHCNVSYPTPPYDANLSAIGDLKRLGITVGYSDHTIGIDAAVLSVALGARIIEKHFTKDKNYSAFRDHQLSADPSDMRQLTERIKTVQELLGSGIKTATPSELVNMNAVRRSAVAARDLEPGHFLTEEDIIWVRPAGGIGPDRESELYGAKLKNALKKGDMILSSNLV